MSVCASFYQPMIEKHYSVFSACFIFTSYDLLHGKSTGLDCWYQNKTSVDSTFSSPEMNMHELNAFEPGLRSSFKLNISLQCCLRCQALSLYMTTFFPYKRTWMVWHHSEKQPKGQTGFHLLSLSPTQAQWDHWSHFRWSYPSGRSFYWKSSSGFLVHRVPLWVPEKDSGQQPLWKPHLLLLVNGKQGSFVMARWGSLYYLPLRTKVAHRSKKLITVG